LGWGFQERLGKALIGHYYWEELFRGKGFGPPIHWFTIKEGGRIVETWRKIYLTWLVLSIFGVYFSLFNSLFAKGRRIHCGVWKEGKKFSFFLRPCL